MNILVSRGFVNSVRWAWCACLQAVRRFRLAMRLASVSVLFCRHFDRKGRIASVSSPDVVARVCCMLHGRGALN